MKECGTTNKKCYSHNVLRKSDPNQQEDYAHLELAEGKVNFFASELDEDEEPIYTELNISLSPEGFKELEKSLEQLAEEIKRRSNVGALDVLKKQVTVDPSYIKYKNPKTGLQIVATTDGRFSLLTPQGVIVQMTQDSIRVKDLDGKVKSLNSAEMKTGLKNLTDAISIEVKNLISGKNGSL